MLPLSMCRLMSMPTCWMESCSEDLWLQTPETESLWVCG